MKQTHTPGPWKAWPDEEITGRPHLRGIVVKHFYGSVWENICRLPDVEALTPAQRAAVSPINSRQEFADALSGETQQDANARLIAAAPDLLAALEPIERIADSVPNSWLDDKPVRVSLMPSQIRAAAAAVRRARGE